ncbi:amidohydrolase family protein [Sphingomonas sp. LM7]|uniref:amidohydrolase family protein n=1 Tax=Sphingomonas sp. LM7 TaxID=1938607 RepID=UPI000983EC3A|nr:amidohydrolase family protein [Sphingomonas sp. LM7]AQR75054.1 amidohydrolase [Sphingomonas sp. LM7]
MKRVFAGAVASVLLAGCASTVPTERAAAPAASEASYGMADYATVPKFDAHVHANVAKGGLLDAARQANFEMLSINVDYPAFPPVADQFRVAKQLRQDDPVRFHFAGTFSMQGWGTPAWAPAMTADIDRAKAAGAVAIKIWKNVGMVERDAAGKLVGIDDPALDPLARHLEARGLPLIIHHGEPHNCWLPLDQMTTDNDRDYFRAHPEYHMYLHPEMPSYQSLMAARDRFVARHPGLKTDGAHLASLEWSIDAMAAYLDAHPAAVIDTAARMSQLQVQSLADREKVRGFFIRYADRILYATDLTENPDISAADMRTQADAVWKSDWRYLATDEIQPIAAIKRDVRGLALPKSVIQRLYWANARRFFALR